MMCCPKGAVSWGSSLWWVSPGLICGESVGCGVTHPKEQGISAIFAESDNTGL